MITCPILGRLFCISGDVSSGFKARVGCLIDIAEAHVMYVAWNPPLEVLHGANLLATSIVTQLLTTIRITTHSLNPTPIIGVRVIYQLYKRKFRILRSYIASNMNAL